MALERCSSPIVQRILVRSYPLMKTRSRSRPHHDQFGWFGEAARSLARSGGSSLSLFTITLGRSISFVLGVC